jgi:hypothetical protein
MKTCKYGCGKMAKGGPVGKVKKMSMGGFAPAQKGGDNTKMGIYGIPNAGGTGPETMKKGGTVKKKLASLAAPKNKITRADVIAGAKMKMRKKK